MQACYSNFKSGRAGIAARRLSGKTFPHEKKYLGRPAGLQMWVVPELRLSFRRIRFVGRDASYYSVVKEQGSTFLSRSLLCYRHVVRGIMRSAYQWAAAAVAGRGDYGPYFVLCWGWLIVLSALPRYFSPGQRPGSEPLRPTAKYILSATRYPDTY